MDKKFEVSYEEIDDILYLGENENIKSSIDLALPTGDVVLDFGYDGLLKGIEIFNASKFFSILSNEIKNIKNASINIIYSPSYASLSINLNLDKGIIKNNLVFPYNKKVILAE